jgi:hypothetical protein
MAIIVDIAAASLLNTYSKLIQAVISFSHRSDLSDIVPNLIRLAEDKIYGALDSNKQDLSDTLVTVADQNFVNLPSDFIKLRTATIISNTFVKSLDYLAPDQLNTLYDDEQTGVPRVYTTFENLMALRPIPDAVYNVSIVYEARATYLSDDNASNWILTNYPLIYLYATLEQVAMYINEDPSSYETEWLRVADGVNKKDWYDSATMQVKTDVNLAIR